MRNSDTNCSGNCEKHGDWAVSVEFLGHETLVTDKCPRCIEEDHESAREESDADAYGDGYQAGASDAEEEAASENAEKEATDPV